MWSWSELLGEAAQGVVDVVVVGVVGGVDRVVVGVVGVDVVDEGKIPCSSPTGLPSTVRSPASLSGGTGA